MRPHHPLCAVAFALSGLTPLAWSQTAPDAGQTLRQVTPQQTAPLPSRPLDLEPPTAPPTAPGGVQVTVTSVQVTGNTVFSSDELAARLKDAVSQRLDLAGLRQLADRITTYYRDAGYPFARAFLPPQDLASGVLLIDVVEGRFGRVQVRQADATLAAEAQPFLDTLVPGSVIQSAVLERATLLLDDLPGVRTTPVLRPGQALGTGDLEVGIERAQPLTGDIGYDNHGNRYSGYHRLRANLDINSPFQLGDQIALRGLLSDEGLWLGSVGYSWPLNGDGWRGQVGYAQTAYDLGSEFASLGANGTAKVWTAGVSHALVRSQKMNLRWSMLYQHKRLRDDRDSAGTSERKSSDSLPLTLQFDRRDDWGGGGIIYGVLGWTVGRLKLDAALATADTNNTRGGFAKIHLDITRLQALSPTFSLVGRVQGQWANSNLDSSEKLALGGPTAVRAYPTGEGNGDTGWLVQMELRHQASAHYAPYLFVDAGSVKALAQPGANVANVQRDLAGVGAGLRYQRGAWSADVTLAWRTDGGVPQSDGGRDSKPRLWLSLSRRL